MQFTHVADCQARLVVRNALTPFRARADYRAVPWVTYTDPELARVGWTESEAGAKGHDPIIYRNELANLDRAMVERRIECFVKLVATRGGRILGATIVMAMQRGLSISALFGFVYPYPTMGEGMKRAADLAQRARLDSPAGRLLKRLVRWRL